MCSSDLADVYNSLNIKDIDIRPDMDRLLNAIEDNDLHTVSANMVNVLEEVTVKQHSQIQYIKNEMLKWGALGSLMSGSGPTVFGLFQNREELLQCQKKLKGKIPTLIMTKTI